MTTPNPDCSPIPLTEMRRQFLDTVRGISGYWSSVEGVSDRERTDGLAFSFLSLLDGCNAGSVGFEVIPMPHPDDQAFHQEEGSDWVPVPPDDIESHGIHQGAMLHELWHQPQPTQGETQ